MITSLEYTIRNKKHSIASSLSSSDKNIDPFMIVVTPNDKQPFRIEKYSEKAKYSYTVDNNIDPDFEITGQEWKDKSWIEKVSKNQTVVYIIDGGQSSETEVRRLLPDEIFSINVHKDKETRKKYSGNADNVVIIKTKKQIKDINQFSFNADLLREDRKVFDEVAERYPIVIDNVPMTKEELKVFDNSKVQSMSISLDMTGKEQSTIVYLYTDPALNMAATIPNKEAYTDNLLYIIDGKEMTNDDVKNIYPNNIIEGELIEFLKGEEVIKKYGQRAKEGVIVITTKSKKSVEKKQEKTFQFKTINENKDLLFIVDGKEISPEEFYNFYNINSDNIESVTVLKDQKTTEKYGERAKDGVIEVTTKSQKEVSLNQKINELKARELAIQKRQKVVEIRTKKLAHLKKEQEKRKQQLVTKRNEIIEKSTQRRKELEQHHQELTEQRKEIRDRVEQRRKELEKSRQEREKWAVNFASAFDAN